MSTFSKSHICPNCASNQYYKSRRKGLWEHILHTFFFVSPFRCTKCDERYFRLRRPQDSMEHGHHHPA